MSGMSSRIQLEFVTGTMLRERVSGFMRLLWCACRGNAFFKFVDMPEDIEDVNTVSLDSLFPLVKESYLIYYMICYLGATYSFLKSL